MRLKEYVTQMPDSSLKKLTNCMLLPQTHTIKSYPPAQHPISTNSLDRSSIVPIPKHSFQFNETSRRAVIPTWCEVLKNQGICVHEDRTLVAETVCSSWLLPQGRSWDETSLPEWKPRNNFLFMIFGAKVRSYLHIMYFFICILAFLIASFVLSKK